MSTATLPLVVAHTLLLDDTVSHRWPQSAHAARNEVRGARRRGFTVHVHRTTDRNGADMLVALIRYSDGLYDGVAYLADVFEFPVDALLDL